MTASSFRRGPGLMAVLALAGAAPCLAQGYGAPLPPSGIAGEDPAAELSRHLRELADNPRDLTALLGAGRAALAAGDANAAIGFFGRADEASPGNARVKAGLGAAMVQLEQPREALRLFAQAESAGLPAADVAADRGLAYDLRGESKRAQAEYQIALAANPRNDEAARRYALSLAISGDRAGALAALDPLMRRQDRAAWRASAFVLALTGDAPGAVTRTELLLPRPQVALIAPFFPRLAALTPAQKASAVHFGRLPGDGRPPPETEFADSRFAGPPPLAPSITVRTNVPNQLPDGSPDSSSVAASLPDRRAPVPDLTGGVPRGTPLAPAVRIAPVGPAYAAATVQRPLPVPLRAAPGGTAPIAPAPRSAAPAPVAFVSSQPLAPPPLAVRTSPPTALSEPSFVAARPRVAANMTSAPPQATVTSAPVTQVPRASTVTPPLEPVRIAASSAPPQPAAVPAPVPEIVPTLSISAPPIAITAPAAPQLAMAAPPVKTALASPATMPPPRVSAPAPRDVSPTPVASATTKRPRVAEPAPTPVHAASAEPSHAPAPAPQKLDLAAATLVDRVERSRIRHPTRPIAGGTTDDLLAVTLPAELAPASANSATAREKPGATHDQDAAESGRKAKDKAKVDADRALKAKDRGPKKGDADEETASDQRKGRKAHDAKDGKDRKEETSARAASKKEPERYWVQVATGANKTDLPKAWRNVKAKYGAQLGGHAPWTTPLRYTNRLLVGPFKSAQEAQAFVNSASKAGMGASTFTSPAGQAIEKLPSE